MFVCLTMGDLRKMTSLNRENNDNAFFWVSYFQTNPDKPWDKATRVSLKLGYSNEIPIVYDHFQTNPCCNGIEMGIFRPLHRDADVLKWLSVLWDLNGYTKKVS